MNKLKNEKIIKLRLRTLGEVELNYISTGDAISFFKILSEEKLSDREFVIKILHNQLIKPKINFEEFKKLSDKELIKIAKAFLKKETYTFQYFKDTGDFFKDFRFAIKTYKEKQYEQIKNIIEPKIKYIKDTLNKFSLRFATSIGLNPDLRSNINDCLQGIEKISKELEEVQLRVALNFKSIIEEYSSFAYKIEEYLKPTIVIWQKWLDKNKTIFENFEKFWDKFYVIYKISKSVAIPILKKYKWFISPSMPTSFIYEAVEIGRRKGNNFWSMNKLFVRYFSKNNFKNLKNLIEGWKNNNIFKPRMKILRDCISTLKSVKRPGNPSNLVISTLIAQIDGIQTEFMKQSGLHYDTIKRRWRDGSGKIIDKKKWLKSQTLNSELLDIANDVLLNILFQGANPGEPLKTPFIFNRHKILHGEYLRYGRIDNTIRAFLILDFLSNVSEKVVKP
jgi:hypothetical protein